MERTSLGSRILRLLKRSPRGLSCSQTCRLLNDKPLSYCYDCRDYGNYWKRKRGILKEPDCGIRKGPVWYRLQQLLKEGLVRAQREKRKDRFMSRGWDWMKIYYVDRGD